MARREFWLQYLKEEDNSDNPGTDGRMGLREIGLESVDWFRMSKDRER